MPAIKFKHIASFSSEDKNYPAENLMKHDGYKKWLCENKGEKNPSVTFQLDKTSKIEQIDIGNAGSAFVEVLVGRSSISEDDYKVLLVASSFMTPGDSRNEKNLTSVRMFSTDKLSGGVKDEKWDRVKVICTQPFNKNMQFGLAFIKVYSESEPSAPRDPGSGEPAKKQTTLGRFVVKEEEDDDVKVGSLFASRNKVEAKPLTGAAAVRAASRLADEAAATQKPAQKDSTPAPKRKYSSDTDNEKPSTSKTPRTESKTSTPSSSRRTDTPSSSKKNRDDTPSSSRKTRDDSPPRNLKKQSTSIVSNVSSVSTSSRSSLKKVQSEPPKMSKEKRFSKLMSKVVFVLSGFQNPLRSQIRDKAMEMGAMYKPDWVKNCTHLICAFENTPKYKEVKGKGRIVTKDWVFESHKQGRLAPWRKHRLGRARTPDTSSESEDDQDDYQPAKRNTPAKQSPKTRESPKKAKVSTYDDSTDVDSEMDTDDEIAMNEAKAKARSPEAKETKSRKNLDEASNSRKTKPTADDDANDPAYDASTDEEPSRETDDKHANDVATNGGMDSDDLPSLPDFYKGKVFYIYGKIEPGLRRKINRYIVAYGGSIEEYMSEKVSFVVTESDWDDNFDDALSDNSSLQFVRPAWVIACEDKQKIVPHQKYIVVPSD